MIGISLDTIAEREEISTETENTYKMIQKYVKGSVDSRRIHIAEVKRLMGLTMYDASNATEGLSSRGNIMKEKVRSDNRCT